MKKKKNYLFIVVIVFILLIIAIFSARSFFETKQVSRKYFSLSKNIQQPWLNKDKIYFYTGSFFATYDLESNKINRLSDYLYINGGILSPSWSNNSIIFQSSPSSGVIDYLSTASNQLGFNSNNPHWWKYDFKQKKLILLSPKKLDRCDSLLERDGSYLCLLTDSNNGNSSLISYNPEKSKSTTLVNNSSEIEDISTQGDITYYVSSDLDGRQSLHSIDKKKKNKTLYKSDGLIQTFQINDTSNIALVTSDIPKDTGTGNVDYIKDKNVKQKMILIEGGKEVYNSSLNKPSAYSYVDKNEDIYISYIDGSIYKINFNKKEVKNIFPQTITAYDSTNFIFSYKSQVLLLDLNNNLLSNKEVKKADLYRDEDSFDINNDNNLDALFWIGDSTDGSRPVNLHSSSVSFKDYTQQLDTLLKENYFEPSEFDLLWTPDQGVHIPLNPSFSLIE